LTERLKAVRLPPHMTTQYAYVLLISVLSATPDAPDPTALSQKQRQTYQQVISEEFCSCSSPLTLSGCLQRRPDCRIARHLGQLVKRGVEAGNTANELLTFFAERVSGPYCATSKTLATNNAPAKGDANAPVTIVEFADFRCRHCKIVAPIVKQAFKRHSSNIQVVFVPFPIGDHPISVLAAEAALAAGAQDRFWEMHDLLFENQSKGFGRGELKKLAKRLKLNIKKFEAALDNHEYRQTVTELKQLGIAAGVQGTPAFFVNGRPFDPDPAMLTFTKRIDMELDRDRGQCQ